MGDQQRWFKLWVSAPSDDHLQRLPPADRWAWAAFGAHTKLHGTRGVIEVSPSNAALAAEMGVPIEALFVTLKRLPHMDVEGGKCVNGEFTVTWRNWPKYQEDSTVAERVRRLRSKRRREEKRTEEKRTTPPQPPAWAQDLVSKWNQAAEQSRKGNPPGLHAVDPEITKKRLRLLHLRWKDLSSDPEWWSQVFARLASSRFACGRHEGKNGGAPWRASFDWVLANDTNAVKVTEGRYDG